MTPVSNVYARLSVLIEDTKYKKLSDEEIEFIFEKYIEDSIVSFKELYKDHKPKVTENELGEKFIIKTKNLEKSEEGESLDLEEEIILSYGMLLCWHKSQIMRDQYLKQGMNTKDFNRLSNATMLANNITLHKEVLREEFIKRRRIYRNRDWNGDGF